MHSRLKTIKCLDNQGLISAYTIIFAGCFMLLVYEPILMYATNTDEFWFDFSTMIIPTMAIFVVFMLIGMAASTVVYYINRIYDKKSSTELFKNIQTDRTRTFIWYRYNRENHMVEYETSGNMKEIEKFKPTGSIYDR